MTYMLTRSAIDFSLGRPREADVSIADIAEHLAKINRFNGATSRLYNVAEHSLLVCDIAAAAGMTSPSGLLAALLHDAHEAYLGDITTPVKRLAGHELGVLDYSLQRAVQDAFRLRTPAHAHQRDIKHADLAALATERRDLLPPSPMRWQVLEGIEPAAGVRLDPELELGWRHWRDAFLARFTRLDSERKAQRDGLGAWLGVAA